MSSKPADNHLSSSAPKVQKTGFNDTTSIWGTYNKNNDDISSSSIFASDAIDYIVRHNQDDIRKLEGFLNKVMFYVYNNLAPNSIITINTVQKATEIDDQNEIRNKGYTVDPQIVINQICSAYDP